MWPSGSPQRWSRQLDLKEGDDIEIMVAGARTFGVKRTPGTREILARLRQISVQVLNELASVARSKLGMSWGEVGDISAQLRAVCRVAPLTVETHERGMHVAERLGLSIYDGTIVASALLSGCRILYTEDLRDGQLIDAQVRVRNPFN